MNIRTALVGSAVALLAVVAAVPAATATTAASDPCVSTVGYKVINSSSSTTNILVSKTKDPYADGQAWCTLGRGRSTRGLSFYVPSGYVCDASIRFNGGYWFPLYGDITLRCHRVGTPKVKVSPSALPNLSGSAYRLAA